MDESGAVVAEISQGAVEPAGRAHLALVALGGTREIGRSGELLQGVGTGDPAGVIVPNAYDQAVGVAVVDVLESEDQKPKGCLDPRALLLLDRELPGLGLLGSRPPTDGPLEERVK